MENTLYYGDNLDVLRRHIADESVDLIYLDPPFNSDQTYNVLFHEQDGSRSAAQIEAFLDTWHWDEKAAASYQEVVEAGGKPSDAMQGFFRVLGGCDMMAYLSMMAPRLKELKNVLKDSGSIYLHCDPTASHYLKVLMDSIFGPENGRNEIIWRRTGAHNKLQRFGPIHDTILFYSKTDRYKWRHPKRPYMKGHVEQYFIHDEKGYRTNYYGNVLTGSGTRGGDSGKPWRGFDPTAKQRHWAIPGALIADLEADGISLEGKTQHEKLDALFEMGCIKIVEGQAWPMYERYLNDRDGQAIQDIWSYQPYTENTVFGTEEGIDSDVRWLSPQDQERLGYPTQKPLGLLERILMASSERGDTVLDPFCGCGTTVAAAQNLGRQWIGIDITHLAITLIRHRLYNSFGETIKAAYDVIGEPTDIEGARQLAAEDKYQFQWWSLGLVNARPTEQKKGADLGIDGRIIFHDEPTGFKTKQIVISVKGGKLKATDVRDLVGVVQREKAAIGVLISMDEPTKPMRAEAATAGFYESSWNLGSITKHPKLQLITVDELLNGRTIDAPPMQDVRTFKKAAKATIKKTHKQTKLVDE